MFNPSRFVSAALLGMAGALSLARPAAAQTGLQFNGSTQYVRSATPGLTASQFTVELWFRRDGTGTGASTGSGGLSGAFPLVAKGAAQAEDNVSDLNYFLGISSTNTLCADFEHFVAAGNSPNHPLTAATGTVNVGTWYHGALTYDGATMKLYLNGSLVAQATPNVTPASSTNTYVAIATTLQTNGTSTAGFFNGAIDEVRIWNVARSQCDIIGSMTQELTSGSGLIARWGLNEGSGTTAVNSSGTPNGELRPTATPPLWVTPGSPFTDPIAPTGLAASAPNPNQGHLTWGDAGGESGYQVERSSTGPGSGFATLATLAANATSYEDFTVSPSTTYWYRVAGTGACNPSYSNVSSATTPLEPCNALSFNTGTTGGYVTFGAAPGLDASAFTVETWFMRTGAGAVTSTGAGGSSALGLTNVVPLVAKGRGEGDGGQIDCNYFLGIQNTPSVVLAADYEHDATSNNNHAIVGTTVLQNDTWYHAAATYDGATFKIYLNGTLEAQIAATPAPRPDLVQHASLATAMNSTGVAAGSFDGRLDEVRIWNVAHTQSEIRATINSPISTAQAGLIGRWAMNEITGTTVIATAGTTTHGTLVGTQPTQWNRVACAPFNLTFNPPAAPTGLGATAISHAQIDLSWTDNSGDETGFEIERSTTGIGGTYSLLTTVAANTTTYSNTGLTPATQYCYRVRAVSTNGASGFAGPTCATTAGSGLDFAGSTYVTFGDPDALDLAQFTVECWFRRDGAGTAISTGATGGVTAVPLVTHGGPQADNSNVDMNYFLGIRSSDGVLCADFEEGAGGTTPGLNHAVAGVTPVGNGWHHGAATYDGTTWNLYLDGNLETSLLVGQPVRSNSIQHAALATSLTSTGGTNGFFDGVLDEVRVWSTVRSALDIQSAANSQIATSQPGLAARWSLDEGSGTVVNGSAGTAVTGTVTGSNYTWVTGAPFNLAFTPPAAPSALAAVAATHSQINLTWNDNSSNENSFQIERSTTGIGGTYSLLASVPAGTTSYANVLLTPSTQYCYRVRAVNGSGASAPDGPACASTPAQSNTGLDFAGNTYVTFGDPAALDLAEFTVECWFRRDGAGTTTTTGTGGIPDAIPLVTHGAPEAENSNVDMNFFLGIRNSDGVLCADFEEGAGAASPGQNHPVGGFTPVGNGWHHGAVTYDGVTWKLYLDGTLEAALPINQPVRSNSIQHAALATALTSTGASNGFFDGELDEVRVWNFARSQTELQQTANAQLALAQSGLVARWSLDEGSGTVVAGSAGTSVAGTVTGSGYTWVAGAPFDLALNQQPPEPVLNAPADHATGVTTSPTLDVAVSDPDGGSLTVTFYGRPAPASPGADFTLIGLPDTQYYTGQLNGGSNAIFQAQTNWIVNNRMARNIVYAGHLGDCVEHGDNGGNDIEWQRASASLSVLENSAATGLPEGLPFGVSVGNHDQSPNGDANGTTTFYNQYFGASHFSGRTYYGGHYGSNNDNWYDLFSVSGMDFIVVSLEYDTSPDAAVLTWADNLLTTYNDRRAIVLSHFLCNTGNPAGFGPQGQATYDALKGHSNLFLMLCGHVPGEGRRQDVYNGNTVHTLLSDYQGRTNGGNGFLRVLEFSPANDEIRVKTYSPWLDQYETDGDSEFSLPYNMNPVQPFALIGSTTVPSGSNATISWPGRSFNAAYEWYAVVSDGSAATQGSVNSFTTTAPPAIRLSETHLDVTCHGLLTGSIDLTVSGGTAPFTYEWGDGPTTEDRTNLGAGTYTVTVTDVNRVTATLNTTIAEPPALALALAKTDVTCNGASNGTATATFSGGTGALRVRIDGGVFATVSSPHAFPGLGAGSHAVDLADANGCTTTASITVAEPPALAASVSLDAPIACHGGTTTVTVSAAGGTPPHAGTGTFTVSSGSHEYTVTDANGCTATANITVAEPPTLAASVSLDAPIACHGGTTTVTVSAAGGTPPHTGTGTFTVSSGSHEYTVTDANGCTATASITVTEPSAITLSETHTPTCLIGPDGSIDLTVSGGVEPYTFAWSNGAATEDISSLTAGSYSVTVTDGSGCGAGTSVTIVLRNYTINASPGANGGIDPTGSVVVNCGADQTFTFTPDPGYSVFDVVVDNTSQGPAPSHTFTGVVANHTLAVSFAENVHTLATGTLGDGTLTRSPDQALYPDNYDVTLTATPAAGWAFTSWSGAVNGSTSPSTLHLTGNAEVTAIFNPMGAPAVVVTFPNGNETLPLDALVTLMWAPADDPDDNDHIDSVDLYLSRTGPNGSYEMVATGIPNTGAYDWPVTGPETDNAYVKVVAHNPPGPSALTAADLSDRPFSIHPGAVAVQKPQPVEFALTQVAPNPALGALRFGFALPRSSSVHLAVIDIHGRRVASVARGDFGPGVHHFTWDARASSGERVASGVYFLHLEVAGRSFTQRFVITR